MITRQDFEALRVPLIALAVTLLGAAAMIYVSGTILESKRQLLSKREGELTQALGRLFALTEAYPDLKATGNVAQLQEELTSTENKIGFARQLYNDTATQYNTKQATFPTMLVAGLAKATPAELWQITDDTERAVPAVDLSSTKPTP